MAVGEEGWGCCVAGAEPTVVAGGVSQLRRGYFGGGWLVVPAVLGGAYGVLRGQLLSAVRM